MATEKLDINQKVYIDNQPVLGAGAGDGALNICREFADQHVENPDKPAVWACGTSIKMTVFLRGRCEEYHDTQWTIGACNTKMTPSTCQLYSPAQISGAVVVPRMGAGDVLQNRTVLSPPRTKMCAPLAPRDLLAPTPRRTGPDDCTAWHYHSGACASIAGRTEDDWTARSGAWEERVGGNGRGSAWEMADGAHERRRSSVTLPFRVSSGSARPSAPWPLCSVVREFCCI